VLSLALALLLLPLVLEPWSSIVLFDSKALVVMIKE
jgi:hypothetical protein